MVSYSKDDSDTSQTASTAAGMTPSPSEPSSSSLSGGAIAGVAVGASVGVFLLCSIIVFLLVKSRRKSGLAGKRKEWHELSDASAVKPRVEMDGAGGYWRDRLVRAVVELPAGNLTPDTSPGRG
jgi:hypothetical protein